MPRPALLSGVLLLALAAPAAAGSLRAELKAAEAALESKDAAALERALSAVVAEGGRAAAKGLLDLVVSAPQDPPGPYWQLTAATAKLTDPDALDAIGDFLLRKGEAPQASDLLFALQNNRAEGTLEVYRRLLDKRGHPLGLMACDRVGELERPEAVDLLLEVLRREEKEGSALGRRAKAALIGMFGEDMGDLLNWEGWWQANRDKAFAERGKKKDGGSTGTVKDELDAARRGALGSVTRKGKVLVLRGEVENFDQIDAMLKRLEVRHEAMLKRAFMADMEKALDGVAALILNCNFYGNLCKCPTCKPGTVGEGRLPQCTGCDKHDLSSDELSEAAIARIVKFVGEGGSVFTEDWGLYELTSRAWPELVKPGTVLTERHVDYAPVPGSTGSSLLRGVLVSGGGGSSVTRQAGAQWKVDDKSPAIQILDSARVTVLLASQALAEDVGADQRAVAITFAPGEAASEPARGRRRRPRTGGRRKQDDGPQGGIVVHVLSHFGKQGTKEDEFTLQNVLVNFLIETEERYSQSRR